VTKQIANPPAAEIKKILEQARTIAVVGLSPDPEKTSHQIGSFLRDRGYRIVPVNPLYPEILGEKAYPSLLDIDEKIDIINIFRRSEQVGPVIAEALQTAAPVIWLQLGIRNDPEAEKAVKAARTVIQDKCIRVEYQTLIEN